MTDELERMCKIVCDLFLIPPRVSPGATEGNCEKSPISLCLIWQLDRIQELYRLSQFVRQRLVLIETSLLSLGNIGD
jgi:hypothetical protein